MKVVDKAKKYYLEHIEFALPTEEIKESEDNAVIKIPLNFVSSYKLKQGSKIHIIFFKINFFVDGNTKKLNYKSEEISLPLKKILKRDDDYMVLIPQDVMKKRNLKIGDTIHVIVHIVVKKFLEELKKGEIRVLMSKKEISNLEKLRKIEQAKKNGSKKRRSKIPSMV